MMTVHLHGRLGRRFGRSFRLAVRSAAEAVRALEANFRGFYEELRPGSYRVVAGPARSGRRLTPEELHFRLGGLSEIHIIPVARGAKNGGLGSIILGAVLVVAAVATAWISGGTSLAWGAAMFGGLASAGSVATLGGMLMLGGVLQLFNTQKVPENGYDSLEKPDARASFVFNGPVNTQEQGGPVPLPYGRCMVGSIVATASIDIERM